MITLPHAAYGLFSSTLVSLLAGRSVISHNLFLSHKYAARLCLSKPLFEDHAVGWVGRWKVQPQCLP